VDFAQLSFSQKKVRLKSFIGFWTSVLVIKMSRSDFPIFCTKDTSRTNKNQFNIKYNIIENNYTITPE
jgi:hypothetical protein